jgi:hypothetical protein
MPRFLRVLSGYSGGDGMSVQLPPPDPHESPETRAEGLDLSAPMVVFATGRPSAYDDRVSDLLLDLRPGLLVVFGSA